MREAAQAAHRFLKRSCCSPAAVDLPVVACDHQQAGCQCMHAGSELARLVAARKGPTHVGCCVANVGADAVWAPAHVVREGCCEWCGNLGQQVWGQNAAARQLSYSQAATMPGSVGLCGVWRQSTQHARTEKQGRHGHKYTCGVCTSHA